MAQSKVTGPKTKTCDLDTSSDSQSVPGESSFFDRIKVSLQSRYIQIVLLLTVCGFFFRFYNITYNSIWLDEAATLNFARHSIIEIWNITANGEFNPPLFHWVEHFILIFGSSELVLRFIPAFFGACTIPLFYWVGKDSIDSNVGVISAALLAFSPFHIFYSQDARAYTTVLFFFTLGLIFYYRALHHGKRSDWLIFGLLSAIAFWTHFYVLIPILGMYCYAIVLLGIRGKKNYFSAVKEAIISLGLFILIIFPLIMVTIRLFIIRTGTPPTYGLQGAALFPELITQISGLHPLVVGFLFIMFLIGMVEIWIQKKNCCMFIAWIFVLTLLLSYILSYSMPMIPRYLICILPFYFTGIAASYRLFFNIINTPKVVYILICIFCVASIPTISNYYTTYSKENWRDVGKVLPELTQNGDAVILLPSYLQMPLEYYYSNESDQTLIYGASNIVELQEIFSKTSTTGRTFFIMTGDITATDTSQETVNWLETNTQFIGVESGIYLFTAPKSG